MAFQSSVVPEDRRFAAIVPLCKIKERSLNVGIIDILAC